MPNTSQRHLAAAVAFLFLAAALHAQTVPPAPATPSYSTPDLKTNIFGGTLSVDKNQLPAAATAIADLARNKLTFTDPRHYQTASHLLGIALRLDPKNRAALIVNGDLENGSIPKPTSGWSEADALKQIHTLAAAAKNSTNKADQMLAAYLYAACNAITPNDDDTYESQLLKQAGCVVKWADATPNGGVQNNSATDSATAVRELTKINGLVVTSAPDGTWYGKVVEILATHSQDPQHQIRLIGTVGRDMKISLDEAVRLATLRHNALSSTGLDISFSDKYSGKDGGSAGTAFTLLMLSAMGDFELNPHSAITGDITVDGSVSAVGGVYAKVHGAALDHCKTVAIPASNLDQMRDAYLLNGISAYWETQTFSITTLDDAIAIMRQDRDPKLEQAMGLFDDLKKEYSTKTWRALESLPAFKEKLHEILALAPNHASAKLLSEVAAGKRPFRLTLLTTLTEALAAVGPMRPGLSETMAAHPERATPAAYQTARARMEKLSETGDPKALPLYPALEKFCRTYVIWANAEHGPNISLRFSTRSDYDAARKAVAPVLKTILSDPAVFEKMMHGDSDSNTDSSGGHKRGGAE
jgi:hypothetical protein